MLEDVGNAETSREAVNPAFEELQVGSVSQAHGVETIGFGPRDIARSRTALGIRVLVMADQRLPVRVTGSFD
jgi:hypothetical protein